MKIFEGENYEYHTKRKICPGEQIFLPSRIKYYDSDVKNKNESYQT